MRKEDDGDVVKEERGDSGSYERRKPTSGKTLIDANNNCNDGDDMRLKRRLAAKATTVGEEEDCKEGTRDSLTTSIGGKDGVQNSSKRK